MADLSHFLPSNRVISKQKPCTGLGGPLLLRRRPQTLALEKCPFRFSAHFLWVVRYLWCCTCLSYLCALETNPFSVASFANIFFHPAIFILFMVSFAVQKLLSIIGPIYLFLFLFSLLWKVNSKRSCCNLCQSVLPVFSSKSFIMSSLIFSFWSIFS